MAQSNRDHRNTERESKGNKGNTSSNDRGESRVRNDDDMHEEYGARGRNGNRGNSVSRGQGEGQASSGMTSDRSTESDRDDGRIDSNR